MGGTRGTRVREGKGEIFGGVGDEEWERKWEGE